MSETIAAAPAPVESAPAAVTGDPQIDKMVAEKVAPPEMFDVKVNGRTVKMSRQEVLDHASMSHAANEKFSEAKKARMEADRILSTAKTNPIEALINAGLTKEQVRDAMEKWYNTEFIEPEALSAEERKIKQYETELKKYKEQEEAAKAKQAKDQEEALTNKQREYLQTQIIEAMDKSGLPKTKENVKKMAFYMRQNIANGWEAPMDHVIRQVKADLKDSVSHISADSTVEQLIDLFGEGIIDKIRQHDLKQLRDRRSFASPTRNSNPEYSQKIGQKVSMSEVNERLAKMRRDGW